MRHRGIMAAAPWLLSASLAVAGPVSPPSPAGQAVGGVSAPVAPKSLTWEEAIAAALARHPAIKAAEQEALARQAVTKQVESANYPQVTGIYANSGGNTRVLANLNISGSLPKPTNYLTTPGLRADYLITDFGQTAHKILATKALAAAAEQAVRTERALAILDVQQAYLNCLKQQRRVAIARETLATREAIRAQAELLYRNQLRSKLDFDFATVEAKRAELSVITAENNLAVAFAALNNAMGLQSREPYVLDDPPITPAADEPLEPLLEQALARRPELLGSRDRVQAAEEALKAAKALHYGNVTAIGTLAYTWWSRQDFSPAGNPTNPGAQLGWYGAGATSAFPLYTGGRISGQVEEAAARTGEVQADARAIANDIALQVVKAYLGRLTAAHQIAVAAQRAATAREALALARDRYKIGLGSILDVMTATTDLLAAEEGLADARYEYRTSEVALAYATGAEIARY